MVKMIDKALISNLTWRSLESQREAFSGVPQFTLEELPSLLRLTQRTEKLKIYVISLAVIASKEKSFLEALTAIRKAGAYIWDKEAGVAYSPTESIRNIINAWKVARREGAAKIGASISANSKKAKSAAGVAKIKDRWGMDSKTWPTKVLLKEAGISYNTAKTLLPPRPIAQYNYQAKLKRKANAKR